MDSSYPDGAQILEITDIANFDDPDMTAKNLMEWSSMDPNASCTVVDNPSSEAVNLTKRFCVMISRHLRFGGMLCNCLSTAW